MADFAFRPVPFRLYMAGQLAKKPVRGYMLGHFPTKAAIYKRDITVRTLKSAIYKRDSGAAREEVAVIAETIAIFRDSFSYNRNYRDFE